MMDASRGAAGATWEAGDATASDAVLCLHGLTSTPYEMQPLASALARRGLHVLAPRLLGHGTRPECLAHTRWTDWLGSARQAFDGLAARHERVFIVGLSMGALLGIVLAHERGGRCPGLVLMGTPLRLDTRTQLAFRVIRALPLAEALPAYEKTDGPDVSDPAVAAAMPSYDRVPLAAAASLLDGQREALARLPRLRTPTLVLHGRQDHVAPVSNARRLYDSLRMPHRRLVIYPRSWHILPLDVESENVVRDVVDFVDTVRPRVDAPDDAPLAHPAATTAETPT
jgi:carboxylesterase